MAEAAPPGVITEADFVVPNPAFAPDPNEERESREDSNPPEPVEAKPASGSLQERMRARRKEIDNHKTEMFSVPGYEETVEVELSVLDFQQMDKITQRHERQRDPGIQKLYVAAEHLLAATVAFHEVLPDGGTDPCEGVSWLSLALLANPDLSRDLPQRAALIDLVGTTQTMFLWGEWMTWIRSQRAQSDTQVSRDFGTTR